MQDYTNSELINKIEIYFQYHNIFNYENINRFTLYINMMAQTNKSGNPMQLGTEIKFIEVAKEHPQHFVFPHEESPMEGFQKLYSLKEGKTSMRKEIFSRGKGRGFRYRFRLISTFFRNMPGMMPGRFTSFWDLKPYLKQIKEGRYRKNGKIDEYLATYPNQNLWEELNEYAKKEFGYVKIGFTKLPTELIFEGKAVLYSYALVFIEEMRKEKMDVAPDLAAGNEVLRVYGTLGKAVNKTARWLRKKGIRAQSVHPVGGLVNLPPLAGKAGMGGQGANGLLITPEFGQRQRIAPVFIEEKIFEYTDNDDHLWIEEYCDMCQICVKKCPVQAIYPQRVDLIQNVEGIGRVRTCIDNNKCFPYFNETVGCSVCIAVCPFSPGSEAYNNLKKIVKKKKW